MWTRPGFNQILYYRQANGREASFCWWRPAWEYGLEGTRRKDKLQCIECTMFHNETRVLSSKLILEAESKLREWKHFSDVSLPDGLISFVDPAKTQQRRSKDSSPGKCFLEAGWNRVDFFSKRGLILLQKNV